jgi:hypothetical protein
MLSNLISYLDIIFQLQCFKVFEIFLSMIEINISETKIEIKI